MRLVTAAKAEGKSRPLWRATSATIKVKTESDLAPNNNDAKRGEREERMPGRE